MTEDGQKYYACSGECKAKIGQRVRKDKKEKEKKEAISQIVKQSSVPLAE